jgi:hypothetical protein
MLDGRSAPTVTRKVTSADPLPTRAIFTGRSGSPWRRAGAHLEAEDLHTPNRDRDRAGHFVPQRLRAPGTEWVRRRGRACPGMTATSPSSRSRSPVAGDALQYARASRRQVRGLCVHPISWNSTYATCLSATSTPGDAETEKILRRREPDRGIEEQGVFERAEIAGMGGAPARAQTAGITAAVEASPDPLLRLCASSGPWTARRPPPRHEVGSGRLAEMVRRRDSVSQVAGSPCGLASRSVRWTERRKVKVPDPRSGWDRGLRGIEGGRSRAGPRWWADRSDAEDR